MQVLASATTATTVHDACPGPPSSSLGKPAASVAAGNMGLPHFAALLVPQSVPQPLNTGTAKGAVTLPGTNENDDPEDLLNAGSPGTVHAGPKVFVCRFLTGDKTLSVHATSAKDETKTVGRRTPGETSSNKSKKEKRAAASDRDTASGAAAPVLLITAKPVPWVVPHRSVVTSPPNSVMTQISPPDKGLENVLRSETRATAQNLEVSRSDEAIFETPDPSGHGPGLQPIASAQPSAAAFPVVPGAVKAPVAIPQGLSLTQPRISPVSDPANSTSDAAVVLHTGSAVQEAAQQAKAALLTNARIQDKTSGDVGRRMAAPVGSTALSTGLAPSGGSSFLPASSMHTIAANLDTKQAGTFPEVNAFQRLDTDKTPATLLHSSPHQIAVGVHDPSLGWLEVQTRSSAGQISATLTTASAEAHASLAAQGPAIAQFLADRNVSLHSVSVHTQADTQSSGSGGGQPQSGSGGAYQGPSELRRVAVRLSNQPLSTETGGGSTSQTLTTSRISIRA